MLELLHQSPPALEGIPESADPQVLRRQLSSRYAELERADRALHEAEQNLKAAHLRFASRQGPRPDVIYREVIQLRERSRYLLDDLGDLFLADSGWLPLAPA